MRITIDFLIIIIRLHYAECTMKDSVERQTVSNISTINTSFSYQNASYMSTSEPRNFVVVYDGSVTRLYCRSPKEKKASWLFAKSLRNLTFAPLPQKGTIVVKNESLSIYRTTSEEAGVYRCRSDKTSRLVVLEVVDGDAYTEVQHPNTQAPPKPQFIGQKLSLFNVWSHWSECSACGEAGRRRRYGMCYVKLSNATQSGERNDYNISSQSVTILQAFPEGIPCRSEHLPDEIRNLLSVRNKNNEIMIITCKVQCKQEIFELCSHTGDILETANNTAGVYSLAQHLPPQPPAPTRDIQFVGIGKRVLVQCAGTTLHDIPVTWRVGSQLVDPAVLRESSGGRVYMTARDHIVIDRVLYEDANLYSCWEGANLAGTVQLAVWAGAQAPWSSRSVLVAMLVGGAGLFKLSMIMLKEQM